MSSPFKSLRVALMVLVAACSAQGQDVDRTEDFARQSSDQKASLPSREARAQASPASQAPGQAAPHRFLNKENRWLFSGVAMTRAVDFASTKNFRSRGRDEILLTNDLVDNTPAFVAVQAGGVAASIAASYVFHRTGHHKIERWISIVHISVGGFGAVRNFMLESRPAQTVP